MKYYTKEIWNEEGYQRTAGIKARDDVDSILDRNGFEAIEICVPAKDRSSQNIAQKALYHLALSRIWDKCLSVVGNADVLLIQFPIVNHSVLLSGAVLGSMPELVALCKAQGANNALLLLFRFGALALLTLPAALRGGGLGASLRRHFGVLAFLSLYLDMLESGK